MKFKALSSLLSRGVDAELISVVNNSARAFPDIEDSFGENSSSKSPDKFIVVFSFPCRILEIGAKLSSNSKPVKD